MKDIIPLLLVALVSLAGLVMIFNGDITSAFHVDQSRNRGFYSYGEGYQLPGQTWLQGAEAGNEAAKICSELGQEWRSCCNNYCYELTDQYQSKKICSNQCAQLWYSYRPQRVTYTFWHP